MVADMVSNTVYCTGGSADYGQTNLTITRSTITCAIDFLDRSVNGQGFWIQDGGVPDLLATYIDRDLLQYDEVWAAAGTPNAVFCIQPGDLVRITNGVVGDVAQVAAG